MDHQERRIGPRKKLGGRLSRVVRSSFQRLQSAVQNSSVWPKQTGEPGKRRKRLRRDLVRDLDGPEHNAEYLYRQTISDRYSELAERGDEFGARLPPCWDFHRHSRALENEPRCGQVAITTNRFSDRLRSSLTDQSDQTRDQPRGRTSKVRHLGASIGKAFVNLIARFRIGRLSRRPKRRHKISDHRTIDIDDEFDCWESRVQASEIARLMPLNRASLSFHSQAIEDDQSNRNSLLNDQTSSDLSRRHQTTSSASPTPSTGSSKGTDRSIKNKRSEALGYRAQSDVINHQPVPRQAQMKSRWNRTDFGTPTVSSHDRTQHYDMTAKTVLNGLSEVNEDRDMIQTRSKLPRSQVINFSQLVNEDFERFQANTKHYEDSDQDIDDDDEIVSISTISSSSRSTSSTSTSPRPYSSQPAQASSLQLSASVCLSSEDASGLTTYPKRTQTRMTDEGEGSWNETSQQTERFPNLNGFSVGSSPSDMHSMQYLTGESIERMMESDSRRRNGRLEQSGVPKSHTYNFGFYQEDGEIHRDRNSDRSYLDDELIDGQFKAMNGFDHKQRRSLQITSSSSRQGSIHEDRRAHNGLYKYQQYFVEPQRSLDPLDQDGDYSGDRRRSDQDAKTHSQIDTSKIFRSVNQLSHSTSRPEFVSDKQYVERRDLYQNCNDSSQTTNHDNSMESGKENRIFINAIYSPEVSEDKSKNDNPANESSADSNLQRARKRRSFQFVISPIGQSQATTSSGKSCEQNGKSKPPVLMLNNREINEAMSVNHKLYTNQLFLERIILQASTSELLQCLGDFLKIRCSALRHQFNPRLVIRWLEIIDHVLLTQGWQEITFINPANLVFLYMVFREVLHPARLVDICELQYSIMTALYLAYSYIGNEISYPLIPFLCEYDTHEDFWDRSLDMIARSSHHMLRINTEPTYFAEVFFELKRYQYIVIRLDNGVEIQRPLRELMASYNCSNRSRASSRRRQDRNIDSPVCNGTISTSQADGNSKNKSNSYKKFKCDLERRRQQSLPQSSICHEAQVRRLNMEQRKQTNDEMEECGSLALS